MTPYPVVTPATVYAKPASPEPAEELAAPPKKKESESKVAPNRARLIVQVPADAKVYIDERPTKVANKATRVFLTPEIERGHDYYYVVRAEVTRDGKALVKSQRVIVRAGGEARASFRDLASSRTVATTAKE